jgi:hypothetical protein
MPSPAPLRETSRLYCQAAVNEAMAEVGRGQAPALTQLVEAVERREQLDKFVRDANIGRYRRITAGLLDEEQRKSIEPPLKEEQAKLQSRSTTMQGPGNHSPKRQGGIVP